MLAAIEAGGTKFVVGVGTSPYDLASIEIPTAAPEETIEKVCGFLRSHAIAAAGLASFGPIDLDVSSPRYGYLTATPKLAWRGYDIVGELRRRLHVPVAFDTDVNAAAIAEGEAGAAKGSRHFVYFTVGTGIGGGAVMDGRLLHGAAHPEMGHIPVQRHPDDSFAGLCPSHRDCLEGMASGPAIEARWGIPAPQLPASHHAWQLEAYYLAQAARTAAMMLSPECIVFGGGVLRQPQLINAIATEFESQLNGYLARPPRVVPSALASAGLVGAWLLAQRSFA